VTQRTILVARTQTPALESRDSIDVCLRTDDDLHDYLGPPVVEPTVGTECESARKSGPKIDHFAYPELNVRLMDVSGCALKETPQRWDKPRKTSTYVAKEDVF
jgi:hypothetical protein